MGQNLDTGPFALVSSSGNVSNADMERERWAKKDRVFNMQKATGHFPAESCPKCVSGCCHRDWHHVGDCCLHCGNDER
jgi:hypothetical protein